MAHKAEGLLVWMDLEMTGLDPEIESIIEIATLITDPQLEIIAEGPELVIHQPDSLLDAMDEWNTKHHKASGLTARVRESNIDLATAEEMTLAFVAEYCHERTTPLAGNSVHQDRRFLQKYMKSLEEHLHYRNVDVSTLKELARRWYPETEASAPPKGAQHRAMDDIRESIEELRYYRKRMFV